MHINKNILLISLALSLSTPAFAKVYKWTDGSGVTHYTATPPPSKTRVKSAEEFKVHKTPKSSLTHKKKYKASVNSNTVNNSPNKHRNNNKYNNPIAKGNNQSDDTRNASSQCQKAINNLPKVLDEVEKLLEMGLSTGKLSNAEYRQKKSGLRQQRRQRVSYSDCVDKYKSDRAERNLINNFADNDPNTALSGVIMQGIANEVNKAIDKARN